MSGHFRYSHAYGYRSDSYANAGNGPELYRVARSPRAAAAPKLLPRARAPGSPTVKPLESGQDPAGLRDGGRELCGSGGDSFEEADEGQPEMRVRVQRGATGRAQRASPRSAGQGYRDLHLSEQSGMSEEEQGIDLGYDPSKGSPQLHASSPSMMHSAARAARVSPFGSPLLPAQKLQRSPDQQQKHLRSLQHTSPEAAGASGAYDVTDQSVLSLSHQSNAIDESLEEPHSSRLNHIMPMLDSQRMLQSGFGSRVEDMFPGAPRLSLRVKEVRHGSEEHDVPKLIAETRELLQTASSEEATTRRMEAEQTAAEEMELMRKISERQARKEAASKAARQAQEEWFRRQQEWEEQTRLRQEEEKLARQREEEERTRRQEEQIRMQWKKEKEQEQQEQARLRKQEEELARRREDEDRARRQEERRRLQREEHDVVRLRQQEEEQSQWCRDRDNTEKRSELSEDKARQSRLETIKKLDGKSPEHGQMDITALPIESAEDLQARWAAAAAAAAEAVASTSQAQTTKEVLDENTTWIESMEIAAAARHRAVNAASSTKTTAAFLGISRAATLNEIGVRITRGEQTAIPVGHTHFSWIPSTPVPLGHTAFSWTGACKHIEHGERGTDDNNGLPNLGKTATRTSQRDVLAPAPTLPPNDEIENVAPENAALSKHLLAKNAASVGRHAPTRSPAQVDVTQTSHPALLKTNAARSVAEAPSSAAPDKHLDNDTSRNGKFHAHVEAANVA